MSSQRAVLGPTLKRELFADGDALGAFVRIAGRRLRAVGAMEPKGEMLGFDLDDAYIPVSVAMQVFNMNELSEIDAVYAPAIPAERAAATARELLIRHHDGNRTSPS